MKKKVLIIIDIVLIVIIARLMLNIPYIAHYNYGNILYKNSEYKKSMEEYEISLQGFIPKYKECKVRINYALAICKSVEVDENDADSISKTIEIYETAIDILEEKNCTKHNETAKKLKDEIQKEIDRLKKLLNNSESTKNQDKEETEKEKNKEENIEERIQKIKEEATKEQRDVETSLKNLEKYYIVNKIERKGLVESRYIKFILQFYNIY